MVQLFIDGGGFMWPILFIFIIGFVFVGERLYHLIKGLASDEDFAVDVANTYSSSGKNAAQNLCESSVGPVANLCSNALNKADEGVEAAEKALDMGLRLYAIAGKTGGELSKISHEFIKVSSFNTSHIQEAHIAIIHAICLSLDVLSKNNEGN